MTLHANRATLPTITSRIHLRSEVPKYCRAGTPTCAGMLSQVDVLIWGDYEILARESLPHMDGDQEWASAPQDVSALIAL